MAVNNEGTNQPTEFFLEEPTPPIVNPGTPPANPEPPKPEDNKVEGAQDDKTPPTPPVEETENYSVNAEGDLVNEKGEVFKKKGEFVIEGDNIIIPDEQPIINSLKQSLIDRGVKVEGEFADTTEGYAELTMKAAEQVHLERLDNLYKSFPLIEKAVSHLLAGGTEQSLIESFIEQKVSYKDIDTKDFGVEEKKGMIMDYLTKLAKNSSDDAKDLIKVWEDKNELDKRFDDAHSKLIANELQMTKAQIEANKEKLATQQAEQVKHWQEIETKVKEGKLASYQIPAEDRTKFFEYLNKDVGNGLNQAAIDYAALPLEKKLELDYILFKGLNLDKLVKIEADNLRARQLSQRKLKLVQASGDTTVHKVGTETPNTIDLI